MTRIATDIGGTFTDLVYVTAAGAIGTAKSHTTPDHFEQGVMDVINASGVTPSEFTSFVHGTTIVINAITEKKGVKTALITSQGFRDVLEIGRGNRPDYFNLHYVKPEPFVPRYLRREVAGRINYKGVESTPLDLADLPAGDIDAESLAAIVEHFHATYEREYTYRLEAPVELVTFHLIAFAEVDKLTPQVMPVSEQDASQAVKGQRDVDYLDAGVHAATIYDGSALARGMSFAGPAVIEEADTTVVIPPQMRCTIDLYGNYKMEETSS